MSELPKDNVIEQLDEAIKDTFTCLGEDEFRLLDSLDTEIRTLKEPIENSGELKDILLMAIPQSRESIGLIIRGLSTGLFLVEEIHQENPLIRYVTALWSIKALMMFNHFNTFRTSELSETRRDLIKERCIEKVEAFPKDFSESSYRKKFDEFLQQYINLYGKPV